MPQKLLLLDRDGTLILEPENYQVDHVSKLDFYPGVFRWLGRIAREMDYELVMITNQDGLGTDGFPEDTFWPVHEAMRRALAAEGITFREELIDRTYAKDNAPTRKPKPGLLTHYLDGDYDLANSYVIGDRLTDMQLAKNIGARGIWLANDPELGADELVPYGRPSRAPTAPAGGGKSEGQKSGRGQTPPQGPLQRQPQSLQDTIDLITTDWEDVYRHLRLKNRTATLNRTTKETDVNIELDLDGTGRTDIQTGLNFFDHMLDQLGRHSGCDLTVQVKGDLHIDEHHTIEDTAIALGEAFAQALGDKRGIERYGFHLVMDDALVQLALDFGGRPWLVWEADYRRERVGDVPTEMFHHFFKSFSDGARCNLNIKAEGQNEHHKIEATFKALAKAIKQAKRRDVENMRLPSTKGVL